tara:strand:+ start:3360 stop:4466 length:1107 start_codon:yes stop_codon:yes gene_type:complete
MKHYESTFEEHILSIEKHNIHPELFDTFSKFPQNVYDFENIIVHGPSGVGKYSQILSLIKRYSKSNLKYEKRITASTDKQQYIYKISDIHYEIDMSLLGCNSKTLWHEIFFQIVDIVSVKPERIGIIVCKNFHQIHTELIDIFYSYMQHYNHSNTNIHIKFIISTDHVSFLPYSIINSCHMINIGRPKPEEYKKILNQVHEQNNTMELNIDNFTNRINYNKNIVFMSNENEILSSLDGSDILNLKDLKYFDLLKTQESNNDTVEFPADIFNIVCNKIIDDICNVKPDSFIELRESLYNMLTYNLDVIDCLWYILSHFISNGSLNAVDISLITERTYTFFKYYNNNYRPIYHLESMLFYIINKIYNLDE